MTTICPADQQKTDTQVDRVGGAPTPTEPKPNTTPILLPARWDPSGGGHARSDTQSVLAPANFCPADHQKADTHDVRVGGASTPTGPTEVATPNESPARWEP